MSQRTLFVIIGLLMIATVISLVRLNQIENQLEFLSKREATHYGWSLERYDWENETFRWLGSFHEPAPTPETTTQGGSSVTPK